MGRAPVKTTMRWRKTKAGLESVKPGQSWGGCISIEPRGRGEDLHYCLYVNCHRLQRAWFFSSVQRCKEFAEVIVHHYELYDLVVGLHRPAEPVKSVSLAMWDAIRGLISGERWDTTARIEGVNMDDKHILRQAAFGEFALLSVEAGRTTAKEFASRHGVSVHRGVQDRVTVDGVDYYWSGRTGKYDGWGRGVA